MKRTFGFICAALIAALIFVLPTGALADQTTGSCGENLTYVWDSDSKTITISGEGAMTDWSANGSPFYAYAIRNNCTSIVVEEGVTTIGSYAFYNLQKVTSLTLPSTLTEIHEAAFLNLRVLTECDIPAGVTVIGKKAFNNCYVLNDVVLPQGLTAIGEGAFSECRAFTSITIPPLITELPTNCFAQNWNVTSFIIPEGVVKAGQYVLTGSLITEIDIPASMTDMLFDSFRNNSDLASYNVAEANPAYCDVDGVLYNKDKTLLLSVPYPREGSLTVDPACLEIGPSAVDGCVNVTEIVLPDGLTTIGSAAFSSTGITSIVIPESVTYLGGGLFGFCENLITAEIYANVDDLGGSTFAGCPAIQNVILGPNVRGFGYACFRDCSSLVSVTVPEGLTVIDDGCFNNCGNLSDFTIPSTVTYIGSDAFNGCSSLAGLEIPAGVTYLGMSAFAHTPITEAVIPEGITQIPGMLFQFCDQLVTVTVLGDLTASEASQVIGSNAFGRCTALEAIHFHCPVLDPNRVAKNAFNGVNTKNFEIHYLNIFPEWDLERPFDTNNVSYNYVADIVASYVVGERVELRPRTQEDSKRDMRFVFRQVNVEGSTVHSRVFMIVNTMTGKQLEIPCRRTFYTDPNGEYELFTLVVTDITPGNFGTALEVYAGIEVTANTGHEGFLYTMEPLVCAVNDLLGEE